MGEMMGAKEAVPPTGRALQRCRRLLARLVYVSAVQAALQAQG